MVRLRLNNDLLFGVSLVLCALIGFYLIRDLRIGSAVRMGPGWLPRALCWVLLGFGAIIAGRGLLVDGPSPGKVALRPIVFVLLAIAAFMVGLRFFGLPAAIIALVCVGAMADANSRWREVVQLSLVLAVFSSLVFVVLLKLPIPLWPVWN
jgi:hypothetical protein